MPVCIFTAHEKNFLSRGAGEDKPKSKEDFQRLYAELESWRMKQEKKISDAVKPGSSPGRFCYFFNDGAQSKSGKVTVSGDSFAMRNLRLNWEITLLFNYYNNIIFVTECHIK